MQRRPSPSRAADIVFPRVRRVILLCVLTLVPQCLRVAQAAEEPSAASAATLTEYRHRTQIPIYDPRRLSLHWIDEISGIDRTEVKAVAQTTSRDVALA